MHMHRHLTGWFFLILCLALPANVTATTAAGPARSLLVNGGFEDGQYFPAGWLPDGWGAGLDIAADPTAAYAGSRSARIAGVSNAYGRLAQRVYVIPNTQYRLSGYIKTENLLPSGEGGYVGAALTVTNPDTGLWTQTTPLQGSSPWTPVSLTFNTGDAAQVMLYAQLDAWGSLPGAAAWFDQLVLEPTAAQPPQPNQVFLPLALRGGAGCAPTAPAWMVLVNVYEATDFTYTDSSGTQRRLVASITQGEKNKVTYAAHRFFNVDVPALTGCAMRPSYTVRFLSKPLTRLSPVYCSDYAPWPDDAAPERDPAFDSVISIWDGSGTDVLSGESASIQGCAWAWPMGTGQLYDAIFMDFVTYSQQNVFKHEWGHSIVNFHDAAGRAPRPPVDNHINDHSTRYVNCITGQPYLLLDQNDLNPIPNSIYNNEAGFTRDYYSGFTAAADQPDRCLGIPAAAWAQGGPVTRPAGLSLAQERPWRSPADDQPGQPVPFSPPKLP